MQPESIFRWNLFALIRPRLIERLNKSFEKYYFHDGLTPVLYLNLFHSCDRNSAKVLMLIRFRYPTLWDAYVGFSFEFRHICRNSEKIIMKTSLSNFISFEIWTEEVSILVSIYFLIHRSNLVFSMLQWTECFHLIQSPTLKSTFCHRTFRLTEY